MKAALQVKRLVAEYGPAIALALVLLSAACAAGAAISYTSPPAETQSVDTHQQEVSTVVHTSAVVTGNSSLYEEDTVLRDMPVYFFKASPNVTLHVKTNVPDGQDVTVGQRLVLKMTGLRGGEQFWTERRVILVGKDTVSNGEAWTNSSINVSRLTAVISDRRKEIGNAGQFSATLRLNISYETNRYTGQLTSETPLVATGRAYWLGGTIEDSRTHATTETRRVVGDPDLTVVAGYLGLGILCLLGAGWVHQRYRDLEPSALEMALTRSRHADWISHGELPTKSEKEYIRVRSLADLVDIAIDSNKRVVYDEEFDVYGVVADDIVYHFSIGDEDLTEWFEV